MRTTYTVSWKSEVSIAPNLFGCKMPFPNAYFAWYGWSSTTPFPNLQFGVVHQPLFLREFFFCALEPRHCGWSCFYRQQNPAKSTVLNHTMNTWTCCIWFGAVSKKTMMHIWINTHTHRKDKQFKDKCPLKKTNHVHLSILTFKGCITFPYKVHHLPRLESGNSCKV